MRSRMSISTFDDKEFVVLVGPSGCGKTTTLRMVAGLESITSGRVLIDDQVVNDLAPMDRDIAMVFQNYALYPHMSVYDNMAFGLKMRKFDKAEIQKRVHEAAEILGIHEYLRRKPRQLSGGQRQRVALGARDRPPSARVPVRRAAVEPRRQTSRADARRTQEAARAARHDGDLRDPRSGRGDDPGRPRRRDARRLGAAGRRPDGAVQRAGQPFRRRVYRLACDELCAGPHRRRERRTMGDRRRHPPQGAGADDEPARPLCRARCDVRDTARRICISPPMSTRSN